MFSFRRFVFALLSIVICTASIQAQSLPQTVASLRQFLTEALNVYQRGPQIVRSDVHDCLELFVFLSE